MTGNLFGWSDDIWRYLDQIGIIVGDIFIVLALVGYLRRDHIRRWLTRNSFPEVGEHGIEGRSWDGIVFTVSHFDTPAWVMQQLRPKAVAFIVSEQSRPIAEELREAARELSIDATLAIWAVDPDNPAQSLHVASELLADMKRRGYEKLAVDVTGGKTPMSLGAFMAAEEAGAASLYVASPFDAALKKPDMRSAQVRIISLPK